MDTRLKKFSHSLLAKAIAFITTIVCFTGSVTIFINMAQNNKELMIPFEKSYYLSRDYINIGSDVIRSLQTLTEYKSEENILEGKTLTSDQISNGEDELFNQFEDTSNKYNHGLSREENYNTFKEVYADKITLLRKNLINEQLNEYNSALQALGKYPGLIYFSKSGEYEYKNSTDISKEYFKSFPAYILFNGSQREVYPEEVTKNLDFFMIPSSINELSHQDTINIAFTDEFLNQRITQWQEEKQNITNTLYLLTIFLAVLALAFIYLVIVIGKKPQIDQEVHLNVIDRIYNDIKIGICLLLIAFWTVSTSELYHSNILILIIGITSLIAALGLLLVLSLVKHLKNKTLIRHTLIYTILNKLYKFIRDIYNSGSVGVKIALIVIGYPIIVAITFFMFPVTIGATVWLSNKKIKEFNAIKEGVRKVKEGDIHHKIDISGNGEFAKLAADINGITDGLHKAVENEIRSERLKTELITNVSHDIRTPLTSIITYVDLLKNETDREKTGEYLEIIDQKAQRLKLLTDDLFEAAKASSGNIPVNFEKIDLISLITQGLGELDDKIQERKLEFKFNYPNNKVYILADGKLLWRSIENLLSNIFKYALPGLRAYIDILETTDEVTLIIKNISAYELNISADELMERFTRGDESRSSQGSGLGLAIAKSLIEIQKGTFNIEIDGDLFKAIIKMRK